MMLRIPVQANMFCLEITDHLALRRKSMSSFPRKKHVTQKSPCAIRRGITTLTQFKISALKNVVEKVDSVWKFENKMTSAYPENWNEKDMNDFG